MNFNLIAVLFAACSSLTAAVSNVQPERLAQAPPVRQNRKNGNVAKRVHAAGLDSLQVSSSRTSSSRKDSSAHSSRRESSRSPSKSRESSSRSPSKSRESSSRSPSKSRESSSRLQRESSSKRDSSLSAAPRSSSSLQLSSDVHENSKACTRRLESILYSPPSTVKDYLNKIANQMRVEIQLIMAGFAAGNMDYLLTFVNKYHILITVSGPFGTPVIVTPTFIAKANPLMFVSFAQTYSGRDGFYVDPSNAYYNYQFSMMSSNGQYITFVLSLPLSAMTNSPTNC